MSTAIAALSLAMIVAHLVLHHLWRADKSWCDAPLYVALALGGTVLVVQLLGQLLRGRVGSDLLAGISIVTAVLLHEYLAGTLVVLMLAGGQALEAYAVRRASSVLHALAKRMPTVAHLRHQEQTEDIAVDQVNVGDVLVMMPHEICPADGTVIEGHGTMDESYLTGEPYRIAKVVGSEVLSGAINGASVLAIKTTRKPEDSRYARIMRVMRESEQQRPRLRRLGNTLGALYTPFAVVIAVIAGLATHDPIRFLAVLVVATPCPLLIAIPVAIIGSISLAARRGIVIKDPAVLEQLPTCHTIIFDKTGTLTYGEPRLTGVVTATGVSEADALRLAASLETYSKHPLAMAVCAAAESRGIPLVSATGVSEPPGQGLTGLIDGRQVCLTGRRHVSPEIASQLPTQSPGLECVLLADGRYTATLQFRDEPRADALSFIRHLGPRHDIRDLILLTGDRTIEANHLAQRLGISAVLAEKSPEEKLAIVKSMTAQKRTAYLGDGINDAPALLAATVGIAFGRASDITSEAAAAVILDPSLRKVDEFFHIAIRLRTIVLQSALGGMLLSLVAVALAAGGYLTPVAGAMTQEAIDVFAVLNALRAAIPPRSISDI